MPCILIPVDFSEASRSVLNHVLTYTHGLPWQVLLLHVVENAVDTHSRGIDPWASLRRGPFPGTHGCGPVR